MLDHKESLHPFTKMEYFGPAEVTTTSPTDSMVRVAFERSEGGLTCDHDYSAQLALSSPGDIREGDRVLVAGSAPDHFYVIGVLASRGREARQEKAVVLNNGAKVTIAGQPEAEQVQVFSQGGDLVFEYDPAQQKSRIHVHAGDLEVLSHDGGIHFSAAGDIRFSSRQSIELQSRQGTTLITRNPLTHMLSSLTLTVRKLSMTSSEIGLVGQRGDIHLDEARYSGKKFVGFLDQGKLVVGRLESVVQDIVLKAKNVYQTISGLTQLRTGRLRTLVDGTSHFKAKKGYIKAEQDLKLQGEKIHLG